MYKRQFYIRFQPHVGNAVEIKLAPKWKTSCLNKGNKMNSAVIGGVVVVMIVIIVSIASKKITKWIASGLNKINQWVQLNT